jgi:hypothetical protein
MRIAVLLFGLASMAAAQSSLAENTSVVTPLPTPTSDTLPQLRLPNWNVAKAVPTAMSSLDASAFLPKTVWLNAAQVPLPDTRTPAQLGAMLAAYVGTWRGEVVTNFFTDQKTARYSVELVYKLVHEQGRDVLVCDGIYQLPGGPQTMRERAWVENGRIVAELVQGRQKQYFAANSRGNSLVWYSTDSVGSLLDFCQTETLRLTGDTGQLHSEGFDVQYKSDGGTLMTAQTIDLKLVKH